MSNIPQPQVDPSQPAPPPERKRLGGCGIAAIGCAVALVILLLVLFLGGLWLYSNARSLGGDAIQQGLTQSVEQSTLPPDQKRQRLDEIEQMTRDYQEGRVTHEAYFEWVAKTQAELTQRTIQEHAAQPNDQTTPPGTPGTSPGTPATPAPEAEPDAPASAPAP